MKKFSVLLLISILGIFTAVQNPSDAIVISANNIQKLTPSLCRIIIISNSIPLKTTE